MMKWNLTATLYIMFYLKTEVLFTQKIINSLKKQDNVISLWDILQWRNCRVPKPVFISYITIGNYILNKSCPVLLALYTMKSATVEIKLKLFWPAKLLLNYKINLF